jgi:hypothetical protein
MAAKLLEDAFKEASKLPEREQESIGSWILSEVRSDRRWTEAFRCSEATLSTLADDALSEHASGLSEDLEPGKL